MPGVLEIPLEKRLGPPPSPPHPLERNKNFLNLEMA